MSVRTTRLRLPALSAALIVSLTLAGCTADSGDGSSDLGSDDSNAEGVGSEDREGSEPDAVAPSRVSANIKPRATDVTIDTPVRVRVDDGTFDSVVLRVHKGRELSGSLNAEKTVWTADELLEPGTRYVVATQAADAAGDVTKARRPFNTIKLADNQEVYPSVAPLDGEVVGIGMPVIVTFDAAVSDHAAFEKKMTVESTPSQRGGWHWMSDTEVHYRPATYWQPGTKVDVLLDINSIPAGQGIYGQEDREINFEIGNSVVMKANLQTDQMGVFIDGDLARTIAITGGKAGFETRSGVKLIVEKFESKRMDAATVGIQPGDPEYYNIPSVEYAQRVTFTGEFLHAAPWSVSAQGSYNVSHGCVGMSTENAAWLFSQTHRGDPVEVTGTDRGMEEGNGWTDWNYSFAEWKQGSAL